MVEDKKSKIKNITSPKQLNETFERPSKSLESYFSKQLLKIIRMSGCLKF